MDIRDSPFAGADQVLLPDSPHLYRPLSLLTTPIPGARANHGPIHGL
jgi:hypothetical protein